MSAVSPTPVAVDTFIARWQSADGSERANYQLFVGELCELLGLPKPDPARADTADNAYVFERRVTFVSGDGSATPNFADCYRRGAFVLEAKKLRIGAARRFDDAMMVARSQAEGYARALPADEGRPPFLLVVDVGNVIDIYAEFSRSGATYTPFPDPRSHRIRLADLRRDDIRARLAAIWLAPLSLDPTREVAARRSPEREGQGDPRKRTGRRIEATARRTRRRRTRRLRLARQPERRNDPRTPGRTQRRARRRRSQGQHPLAAPRFPESSRPRTDSRQGGGDGGGGDATASADAREGRSASPVVVVAVRSQGRP